MKLCPFCDDGEMSEIVITEHFDTVRPTAVSFDVPEYEIWQCDTCDEGLIDMDQAARNQPKMDAARAQCQP